MIEQHKFAITIMIFLTASQAKMMRNSALITKMVSNFHQNNNITSEPNKEFDSVLTRMQIVLCKNFPTIPCKLITQDNTLKKLIEKSIQQINNKKTSLDKKTTPSNGYLRLFPMLNNDDLSKFIQMSEVFNSHEKKHAQKKNIAKEGNRKVKARALEKNSREKSRKIFKIKSKRTSAYNRKKLRKFYPHKVKYTNKNSRKVDVGDSNAEKFSMSVEAPDMPLVKQHQHFSYKAEPDHPPVWRIDYTKHGEPSIHVFDYGRDGFNGKITKTGPNILMDGNEQTRKNIIHPDVFIKNNFVKTYSDNSDSVD
ncbi:jg13794 [Pararge aegeria aegeria]|uniref:Jg13794 protein n=1 Tax=Pararge aegeria aegeria TaxID=348720 RepID=A0A8S4S4D6_9NEOP|nr:jg13794 [Pararge aegeria aegeria]